MREAKPLFVQGVLYNTLIHIQTKDYGENTWTQKLFDWNNAASIGNHADYKLRPATLFYIKHCNRLLSVSSETQIRFCTMGTPGKAVDLLNAQTSWQVYCSPKSVKRLRWSMDAIKVNMYFKMVCILSGHEINPRSARLDKTPPFLGAKAVYLDIFSIKLYFTLAMLVFKWKLFMRTL